MDPGHLQRRIQIQFEQQRESCVVASWGECPNPAFALQRHASPTAGVMEPFFNKPMLGHTARLPKDCLHHITTLPWPAQSPDLSPITHILNHVGWQVGQPTSLGELEARLQQLRNEMSQDSIRNLYASMPPTRIAPCIPARRGPTEC
ncbi:transposable element Tcb1 transposase [Trichonephila clavipes]|nr:transposable element Tcb1 transposase [Trichonephila clavipes]